MKCSECGAEAREGTRFCRQCGEMLEISTGKTFDDKVTSVIGNSNVQVEIPASTPLQPTSPINISSFSNYSQPSEVNKSNQIFQNKPSFNNENPFYSNPPQHAIYEQQKKKSNVGLFLIISGVTIVGLLLMGFIALMMISQKTSTITEKSRDIKANERGEYKIIASYLTSVKLSYMDTAPKNNNEIVYNNKNEGTSFPSGIRALVLHLEGETPEYVLLNIIWTYNGNKIHEQGITNELKKDHSMDLSIYKPDGRPVDNGEYKVEVRDIYGHTAAYVKFYVGD